MIIESFFRKNRKSFANVYVVSKKYTLLNFVRLNKRISTKCRPYLRDLQS
jgi:hypothetical protein